MTFAKVVFTSSWSIAQMTLCLNLMFPLYLRRSKHSFAYSLLFRFDEALVSRAFMLQNNLQELTNLCILSIPFSLCFLSTPNSTIHLCIRIGKTENLDLDKINMVIVLPLAMLSNARDWRLYVLFEMQHCNGRLIDYQSISIFFFFNFFLFSVYFTLTIK